MKVVINICFGGFGLSQKAYERLIELGVPIRKYIPEKRGEDGRFIPVPENEGEVIFDDTLADSQDDLGAWRGRYWETWTRGNREHPLIIQVVEELGKDANGQCADLKVVEVPDGIEYEISEYDGLEHIAEKHRTWG